MGASSTNHLFLCHVHAFSMAVDACEILRSMVNDPWVWMSFNSIRPRWCRISQPSQPYDMNRWLHSHHPYSVQLLSPELLYPCKNDLLGLFWWFCYGFPMVWAPPFKLLVVSDRSIEWDDVLGGDVNHPGPAIGGHFPDLGGVPAQSKKEPCLCRPTERATPVSHHRNVELVNQDLVVPKPIYIYIQI